MKKFTAFLWKKCLLCSLAFLGIMGCNVFSCAYGGPPVDIDEPSEVEEAGEEAKIESDGEESNEKSESE